MAPFYALQFERRRALALAGLVALLRLVDDIDAALAAHQLVVAMAQAQGFQGIANFHDTTQMVCLKKGWDGPGTD